MGLTSDQRVAISLKIVQIPQQNAQTASSQSALQTAITQAQAQDNTNMSLMDGKTTLITPYETEKQNLDGNGTTTLTEQMLLDSAARKAGNYFFPNQQSVPLPHETSGVWKFLIPFYYSVAQGKNSTETYNTVTNETTLLATIQTNITTLLSKTLVTRVTGESCTTGTPDVIAPDTATQTAMTNILTAVTSLQACLSAEQAALNSQTDTDPARSSQNATALSNITTISSALTTWLALNTFKTPTSPPTTCATWNAQSVTSLLPTKADSTNLPIFQSAITARQTFVATRITQIAANLGTVAQNTTDGTITTATGFYGDRAKIIGMRLNAIGGTLSQLQSLNNSNGALNQLTAANANAADVYSGLIAVTTLAAPANGTAYINVTDASQFAPGQLAYVASASQPEMPVYIKSVNANQVLLDRSVPPTYLQSDSARLYREL